MVTVTDDLARDGVVVLRGALSPDELSRIEDLYEYGRSHPSAGAYTVYPETGATFYIDTFNAANWDADVPAFRDTSVPDHVQRLWGSEHVWFFYEQLFLKEGGSMRRTPWHQDASSAAGEASPPAPTMPGDASTADGDRAGSTLLER